MIDNPYRMLVTGSRRCSESEAGFVRARISRACSDALASGRRVIIVHGKCKYGGVDLVAHQWAELTDGAEPEPHPADWDMHGRAAGMIRNSEMVQSGADECLAFPHHDSRGTYDCAMKAAKAGIVTYIYPLD